MHYKLAAGINGINEIRLYDFVHHKSVHSLVHILQLLKLLSCSLKQQILQEKGTHSKDIFHISIKTNRPLPFL